LTQLAGCFLKSKVDIGCGDGRLARGMQKMFPHKDIECIDHSARAIALAHAMNPDLADLRYEQADVKIIPFPENVRLPC
jgi:trans-aconitate methyltransferase